MLTTTYYVSKLNNGCTFFGTLSSIERIAKGIKTSIIEKASSKSLDGDKLFAKAQLQSL